MVLNDLYIKYKELDSLWKKILLAIPIAIVLLLLGAYLLYSKFKPADLTLIDKVNEDAQDRVDEIKEKDKELQKEEKVLEDERKEIKEEMEKNDEEANDLDDRIDAASDMYELERIRREICERRQDSTDETS